MAKTRLRNVGGGHRFPAGSGKFFEGRDVAHGEVFEYEGDAEALIRSFPNKFERVARGEDDAGTETSDGRDDVTTDFPTAAEADLRVLRDKRGWWIIDEGDDPINEKPLKKKDVEGAIEAYLEEE